MENIQDEKYLDRLIENMKKSKRVKLSDSSLKSTKQMTSGNVREGFGSVAENLLNA